MCYSKCCHQQINRRLWLHLQHLSLISFSSHLQLESSVSSVDSSVISPPSLSVTPAHPHRRRINSFCFYCGISAQCFSQEQIFVLPREALRGTHFENYEGHNEAESLAGLNDNMNADLDSDSFLYDAEML